MRQFACTVSVIILKLGIMEVFKDSAWFDFSEMSIGKDMDFLCKETEHLAL